MIYSSTANKLTFGISWLSSYKEPAKLVHVTLKEICIKYAEDIDKRLFKRQKKFLLRCPTYQWDEKAFKAFVNQFTSDLSYCPRYKSIARNQWQLPDAIAAVTSNDHGSNDSCWKCNSQEVTTLQVCSQCGVAQYCSKECQTLAWKPGHKEKCKTLKETKELFEKSLEAVDEAHKKGFIKGLRLSAQNDYTYALDIFREPQNSFQKAEIYVESELFGRPHGPSMKYFYENLVRVVQSDWWFFKQSESETTAYSAKFERSDVPKFSGEAYETWIQERKYMQVIVCGLSYDIFGLVANQCESNDVLTEKVALELLVEQSLIATVRDEMGVSMPAERFLSEYFPKYAMVEDSEKRQRKRSNTRFLAMQYFRDNFHM